MPRLDLWYPASLERQTLPAKYEGMRMEQISLAEGWTPYRFMPDFLDVESDQDLLHKGLGLISIPAYICSYRFGSQIEVRVKKEGESTQVEYHTEKGVISTAYSLPKSQRKNGATYPLVTEHPIKNVVDYGLVAHLFNQLEINPAYERFATMQEKIGTSTLCFAAVNMACSPMHHILRDLVDPTKFFIHSNDHPDQIGELVESLEPHYHSLISIAKNSPAQALVWGANYDDTLTYPALFEKHFLPWIQKFSEVLHQANKYVGSHLDGENLGLMDLVLKTGLDVADSVCPYPMGKVAIRDYYRHWGERVTIFGGIPQDLLLPDVFTLGDLHDYLDLFFQSIVPGTRFVAGIADAVPPDADFSRLFVIADRIEKEGRLSLMAGGFNPVDAAMISDGSNDDFPLSGLTHLALKHKPGLLPFLKDLVVWLENQDADRNPSAQPENYDHDLRENETQEEVEEVTPLSLLAKDVLEGDGEALIDRLKNLLDKGWDPRELLQDGMLAAMEVIGQRFKDGTVFIPEVLISARALNEGVELLEPYLAKGAGHGRGKILIGTVAGDLHDIGKNLVLTMLRGVGFETVDLGINVPAEKFVQAVIQEKPEILGLSALLTTTMPEMRNVINALREAGIRDDVKVVVGGAPVSKKYASEIGADAYAEDAGDAVNVVKDLINTGSAKNVDCR